MNPLRIYLEGRVAEIFASGEPITVAALAQTHAVYAVKSCLDALETEGRLTWQRAKGGKGQVPHIVNLSPLPLDGGDLRHVLGPFLLDSTISPDKKRHTRTMVRFITDAPTQCSDATLLVYASHVPASELQGMPALVDARAVAKSMRRSTRRNYKSMATHLVRYAAAHKLVPLVFPRFLALDAWEELRAEAWPGNGDTFSAREHRCRADWTTTREAFLEVFGENASEPRTISRAMFDETILHLKRTGRFGDLARLRTPWRDVGRRLNIGPLTGDSDGDPTYLRHPAGEAINTFEKLASAMKAMGFGEEWIDALQYHRDCACLTDAELRKAGQRFPAKRIRRKIKATTYEGHVQHLRALLGVVVNRLQYVPAEVSPFEVFGDHLAEILDECEVWWREKYERGEVTAPATSTLSAIMRIGSALAYTLWAKSRHERHAEMRGDPTSKKRSERQMIGTVEMTALEHDLFFAYETATGMADAVERELRNSEHGTGANTWKDIARVVEQTPFVYWKRTLDLLVLEVDIRRARGDHDRAYHGLVAAAYKLGWLISTGMRWQEAHHVRLDLQYSADFRKRKECKLRPRDRKNSDAHTTAIRLEYIPDWLETEYLCVSRPALVGAEDHPWLFVQSSGCPIGCRAEGVDGLNRDELGYRGRLTGARLAWQAEIGPWAYRANGYCPTDAGYFTPHCIRNAVAAELYIRFGVQRAADYLGDDPKVVRNHYGFLSGSNSRVGELSVVELLRE